MIEFFKRIQLIFILFILQLIEDPSLYLKTLFRKIKNRKSLYQNEELAGAIFENRLDRIREQLLLAPQNDSLFDIHPYIELALEKSNFRALQLLLTSVPSSYNFANLSEKIFDHLIYVPPYPVRFFKKIDLTEENNSELANIFGIIASHGGLHPNKPYMNYTLFGLLCELRLTEALPIFFKYKANPYVTSTTYSSVLNKEIHFYNAFMSFYAAQRLEGVEIFLENGFDSSHKLDFKACSARDQIIQYMERDLNSERLLSNEAFLFYQTLFNNPLAMDKIFKPVFKKYPSHRATWEAVFLKESYQQHRFIKEPVKKPKKEKPAKKIEHTPPPAIIYKLYVPKEDEINTPPRKTSLENILPTAETEAHTTIAKKHIPHPKNKMRSKDILLAITDRQIERERARALEKKQKQEEADARKLAKEHRQRRHSVTENKSVSLTIPAKQTTASAVATTAIHHQPHPLHNKLRTLRLNEACKHLIFIKRILASQVVLDENVVHYALLYNIFRCFVSLKEYQKIGGTSSSLLNKDSVIDLRNLIRHYGACDVSRSAVLEFAHQIKGDLPQKLVTLRQDHLWKFELSNDMRKALCREFDITDKNDHMFEFTEFQLMIEDSRLFRQLKSFLIHQSGDEKNAPEDIRFQDRHVITETFLPAIATLLKTIGKISLTERTQQPDNFINTYLTHLQALRYLVMICSEYRLSFADYSKELSKFLAYCHDEGCSMAHTLVDLDAPVYFANMLESKFTQFCEGVIQDTAPSTSTATQHEAQRNTR